MAHAQKVLIVDDDPVSTAIYGKHFEIAKFSVQIAGDAAAGLVALRTFKPDVVLLDLNMPHRSGLDWLGTVRRIDSFKHLPVVVLTAQPLESPLVHEAMAADVTGVLFKESWGVEAVVAAVKWLASRRPLHAMAMR